MDVELLHVLLPHLDAVFATRKPPTGARLLVPGSGIASFSTLAAGSALAFVSYPFIHTAVLSASRREVVLRNAPLLWVFSLSLGFLALLGNMAIAAGPTLPALGGNAQNAAPAVFNTLLPSWFAGICLSAILIGALVPAAVMSISAATLFARDAGPPMPPHGLRLRAPRANTRSGP